MPPDLMLAATVKDRNSHMGLSQENERTLVFQRLVEKMCRQEIYRPIGPTATKTGRVENVKKFAPKG